MADVTLRDLIRAAHASGAPLRRRFDGIIHRPYWEFWGEGIDRRRALVRYWPDGLWRVDLYSHYVATHDDINHAVHVALIDPTLAQIIEGAALCGWDLATVDRGEATDD